MSPCPFQVSAEELASAQEPWSLSLAPMQETDMLGGSAHPILLVLRLPADAVAPQLQALAEEAAVSPRGQVNGAGLIQCTGGMGNWQVWLRPVDRETGETIMHVRNDLDGDQNLVDVKDRGTITREHALSLAVALMGRGEAEYTFAWHGDTAYQNEARQRFRPRYSGQVQVRWTQQPDTRPSVPKVRLWTPQEAQQVVTIGSVVQLRWLAENCLRAKLTGPLPGGQGVLDLAVGPDQRLEGEILVRAMGLQIYILEAVVKGSGSGDANVTVFRRLLLDVLRGDQYAAVDTMQDAVFPHNRVTIRWAAWGVFRAQLAIAGVSYLEVLNNRPGEDHVLEGQGSEQLAVANYINQNAQLSVRTDQGDLTANALFSVLFWQPVQSAAPVTTQNPVRHAAYCEKDGQGLLAFLDGQELRIWQVGLDDRTSLIHERENIPAFTGASALAAAGDCFFLLQPKDGKLHLIQYVPGYTPQIWTTPLFDVDRAAQIFVLGNRVYVAGGLDNGYEVWSQPFKTLKVKGNSSSAPEAQWIDEPRLSGLHARFAVVGDALLAVASFNNQAYLFRQTDRSSHGGSLTEPLRHQNLTRADGKALAGYPLVVEELLVFMGGDNPNLISDDPNTIAAVTSHKVDYVYNTQTRRARKLGRERDGLTAAVYRSGGSRRIWGFFEDGCYTLSVNDPRVFDEDYVAGNPIAPSVEPGLRRELELWLDNRADVPYARLSPAFAAAGLAGLRSSGHFTYQAPRLLEAGSRQMITLFCEEGSLPSGTISLMDTREQLAFMASFSFPNGDLGRSSWRFFMPQPPLPKPMEEPGVQPVIRLNGESPSIAAVYLGTIQHRTRCFLYNHSEGSVELIDDPHFAGQQLEPGGIMLLDYAVSPHTSALIGPKMQGYNRWGDQTVLFQPSLDMHGTFTLSYLKNFGTNLFETLSLKKMTGSEMEAAKLPVPKHLLGDTNWLLQVNNAELFEPTFTLTQPDPERITRKLEVSWRVAGAYNRVQVYIAFPKIGVNKVIPPYPPGLSATDETTIQGVVDAQTGGFTVYAEILAMVEPLRVDLTPNVVRDGETKQGQTVHWEAKKP